MYSSAVRSADRGGVFAENGGVRKRTKLHTFFAENNPCGLCRHSCPHARARTLYGCRRGWLVGEEAGVDAARGSEMLFDVATGYFAMLFQVCAVVEQPFHYLGEFFPVGNGKSAFDCNQVAGFFEFTVVWPENDGYAVDGSFVDIVDAGAKSPADVGGGGETIAF